MMSKQGWARYVKRLDIISDEWDTAYVNNSSREELNRISQKRDELLKALGLMVWHDLTRPDQDEN